VILIYTQHLSNRLTYVLDFCFKSKFCDYSVTDVLTDFKNFEGLKINYSAKYLQANLTIKPEGLLCESDIHNSKNVAFKNEEWEINGIKDDFSLIFYFLTCYEEYVIKERDKHDRFSAKSSTFTLYHRLDFPNVDLIIKSIWEKLGLDYSTIQQQHKTILTFDIDSAWAIKHKSLGRKIGSDIKSLLKGESLKEKIAIRKDKQLDPFDTFSQIIELSDNYEVLCFILLGNWGKYDKNIHWKNKAFRLLIESLSKKIKLGIHPSYQSYLKGDVVKKEIDCLNFISGKKTYASRQHFLKLQLPESYNLLIKNGIKEDYSMGFADGYGFRAGTCFPFYFFDLHQNSVTDLKVFPISYMDGTLNQYLKKSIHESVSIVNTLKMRIKDVGGYFIPLWHNETIGEHGIWKGWKSVFDENLK